MASRSALRVSGNLRRPAHWSEAAHPTPRSTRSCRNTTAFPAPAWCSGCGSPSAGLPAWSSCALLSGGHRQDSRTISFPGSKSPLIRPRSHASCCPTGVPPSCETRRNNHHSWSARGCSSLKNHDLRVLRKPFCQPRQIFPDHSRPAHPAFSAPWRLHMFYIL